MAGHKGLRRGTIGLISALVAIFGQFGFGGILPAAAATNCANNNTCRWTQMENGNWQPNSNQNPSCSPCVSWPPDPNGGGIQNVAYWNSWQGQGSMFDNEVNWAANQWGSQQYYSPSVYECNCSNTPINYNAESLPASLCGSTYLNYSVSQGNQGNITGATVYLNSNAGYVDGPSKGSACDLRNTLLHETGHVFGEGHSSVQSDVMYPHNNNIEAIDQDAQNMMAAIYGTYEAGCTSDYCGGNADVNLPVTVHPVTTAQLEQIVQEKARDAEASHQAEKADSVNIAISLQQQVYPQPLGQPAQPMP